MSQQGAGFKFEYLGDVEFIFVSALGYVSGGLGRVLGKTAYTKSLDTVPLTRHDIEKKCAHVTK